MNNRAICIDAYNEKDSISKYFKILKPLANSSMIFTYLLYPSIGSLLILLPWYV